jgi:guanylate kinase
VSREEIELGISNGNFIEYGEFNGNLYGTMDKSILALLSQGKTPVINAHCLSLRKLRTALFKPLGKF